MRTLGFIPLLKIDKPVPFYEVKGEFTVDLPYELEGWSKGQDLSKMDKEELEKKVVEFYEKSRTILNNGDSETWRELTNKRLNETYIFNYTLDEDKARSGKLHAAQANNELNLQVLA